MQAQLTHIEKNKKLTHVKETLIFLEATRNEDMDD